VITEALVEGVAPDAPCGDDLSYDPAFMELERAAQGAPQGRIVGPDVVAEGPDWRIVQKQATALLARTKDLRVAVLLAKALLRTQGFEGFRDGTWLVKELLVRYWDTLHPQLTEEDDFSPIMRSNALRDLLDRQGVLNPIRALPIVNLAGLGSFSLRDVALARGEMAAVNDAAVMDMAKIDAAFDNCPLEPLAMTANAVHGVLENLQAIESYMSEKVGAHHTVSFEDLSGLLRQIDTLLEERLGRRSSITAIAPANVISLATGGVVEPISSSATYSNGVTAMNMSSGAASSGGPVPNEIRTRDDVIRALTALCSYYQRHEPSSPVPMLLRRAQRLVHMSFEDIMKDLAPGAMSEIEKIRGPEEPQTDAN